MGRRVIPFILGLVIFLSSCDNMDLSAQLEESIQKSQGVIEDVTFSPGADQVYTSSTTVTLTTNTADIDEIRYITVTDASDPGSDYSTWNTYDSDSGIVLYSQDITTLIYVIALKSDMIPSDRTSGWYKITGTCEAPLITPASSTPAASHSVTLSTSTSGATIKYTLDGTTPSADNGEAYESAVTITANASLNAIALKTDWANSSVTEEDYTIAWSRTHGNGNSENIASGVVAYDGNYFISTGTSDSATNSHVMKLNSDGTLNWSVEYDQPIASAGKNITLSVDTFGNPDGGIITCGRTYDSTDTDLYKLNADGTIGWQKTLKIDPDIIISAYPSYETIKSLSDGRYLASGSLYQDGKPTIKPLVSLISNSGTVIDGYDVDIEIEVELVTPGLDIVKSGDTDSGFVICGYFLVGGDYSFIASTDFNRTAEISRTWEVSKTGTGDVVHLNSVCAASDGTYMVAGTSNGVVPLFTNYNTILMKIDPSVDPADALVWQKSYGFAGGNEAFFEVIETLDGNFIAVGEAEKQVSDSSDMDGWIVKFNSDGTIIWQKAYGGLSWDSLRSITPAGDGGYIVTGMTESFTSSWDTWTMKIDSEGNPTQTNTSKDIYLGIATEAVEESQDLDFIDLSSSIDDSYALVSPIQTGTSTPTTWTTTDTQYE